MKKLTILLVVFALFVLAGCQDKSAANPSANSDNGTAAINSPENSTAAKSDALAEGAAPEPKAPSEDVLEIKEKMFVAQTNDIYFNPENYLGKTIKYEGIFSVYEAPDTGVKYCWVFRYGPGCCGIDANCGFEVIWEKEYPSPDDWVEAIGVLEQYEEDGWTYLRLALSSLTVLPTRGAEYVNQ